MCHTWLSRVRPALMRAAAASQLHELAAYHSLARLRDLQQQLQALLPKPASADTTQSGGSADAAVAEADAAALSARMPLGLQQRQRLTAADASPGGSAANPAAALLAATRGSPELGMRGQQALQEPGSPARGRQLSQQQVQQAAAKVADATAVAAAALCALGDADGIAGLQAYCRSSFAQLLRQLYTQQQEEEAAGASPDPAAAADSAWDWMEGVQQQAAGRYEAALLHYSMYSGSGPMALQCAPAGALAGLVARAYAAVGDAAGLHTWLQVRNARRRACMLLFWQGLMDYVGVAGWCPLHAASPLPRSPAV